jgi:hypothetical protein
VQSSCEEPRVESRGERKASNIRERRLNAAIGTGGGIFGNTNRAILSDFTPSYHGPGRHVCRCEAIFLILIALSAAFDAIKTEVET